MARRRSTRPQLGRISGGVIITRVLFLMILSWSDDLFELFNSLVQEWLPTYTPSTSATYPSIISIFFVGTHHHPSGHMCSPVHTTSHSVGPSGKLPLPYNIMDHSCSTDIGLYTSSRWHLSRVNWIPHCSLNIHPLDSHSVLFRRPFKCHFHANCVPQPPRM